METIYRACDGNEFLNDRDCLDHENRVLFLEDIVKEIPKIEGLKWEDFKPVLTKFFKYASLHVVGNCFEITDVIEYLEKQNTGDLIRVIGGIHVYIRESKHNYRFGKFSAACIKFEEVCALFLDDHEVSISQDQNTVTVSPQMKTYIAVQGWACVQCDLYGELKTCEEVLCQGWQRIDGEGVVFKESE